MMKMPTKVPVLPSTPTRCVSSGREITTTVLPVQVEAITVPRWRRNSLCYGGGMNCNIFATMLMLLLLSVEVVRSSSLPPNDVSTSISFFQRRAAILSSTATMNVKQASTTVPRGGGKLIPAGYNPFGYFITDLGLTYLEFQGSLESDVGRFLASVKKERKTKSALKEQWLEILRVSKTGQTLRIYKDLDSFIDFCLKAKLID